MKNTIKYSIISFFIVSLFLSVFVQSVVLFNYAFDQDNYTEKYCENIESPELNCYGTCHLTKELKFSSVKKQNSFEEVFTSIISIFSFQQINEFSTSLNINKNKSITYFVFIKSTQDYISKLFKPPCYS